MIKHFKMQAFGKCLAEVLLLQKEGKDFEQLSCDEFKSRYGNWTGKELNCLYKCWQSFGNLE